MAKLYFYYSAMNAGKSTILLQANYNYNERGMGTLLYTPEIDNRYGVGNITSRIGLQAAARVFNDKSDLYQEISQVVREGKLSCVLVDEAQFLSKNQVWQLCRVVDCLDVPVLCYGLRADFKGEPFSGSLHLLAVADNLVEVKTVCHCGRKATMNMRVDEHGNKVTEGAQIEIGGNSRYIAVCRKHFLYE